MDEEIVIWRQNGATIYIGHDIIKPKVQYHGVRKIILRKECFDFSITELVNFLLHAHTQAIRQILGKASSNNNALSINGIFYNFFFHILALCVHWQYLYTYWRSIKYTNIRSSQGKKLRLPILPWLIFVQNSFSHPTHVRNLFCRTKTSIENGT